jgi:hypothetical protein
VTITPPGPGTAQQPRHSVFGDTFAVVRSASRLVWRHWPVLLSLAVFGFVLRYAFTYAAVKATALHPAVAVLVYALIPISMLVPMLIMLRIVRRSLPDPPDPAGGTRSDRLSGMSQLAGVLIPFLAVYAAYEYFEQDRSNFYYEVWLDETFNNPDLWNNLDAVNTDERLPSPFSLTMATLIGAAVVLRMVLGFVARNRQPGVVLGFSRVYLEATWISMTALPASVFLVAADTWLNERELVNWLQTAMSKVTALFGPFSGAADTVVAWLGQIVGTADAVIIIPIAWLTIGCIVYGHEIVSPPRAQTEAIALQRWQRLNPTVRSILLPVRNAADDRLGPMVRGLSLLKHAGLPTMLLFCLAFVVAQSAPELLWEVARLIVGPQDLDVWEPLAGPVSTFSEAIGLMLTICLVAAAVDHVLRVPPPAEPAGSDPIPPSPGDGQPDVTRIQQAPVDLQGGRFGVGGRDEQSRDAVLT